MIGRYLPNGSTLVVVLVVALALAGCVHDGDGGTVAEPDDASANDTSDATEVDDGDAQGNASTSQDPVNETQSDGDGEAESTGEEPPAAIDEAAVSSGVRRGIRSYRKTTGHRDTRHAQGLVRAARRADEDLADAGAEPPFDVTADGFDMDEDALLERYRSLGAEECDRDTENVLGLVAAARDVVAVSNDPAAQGATVEEKLVDHIVFSWKRDATVRETIQRDYRFDGVHTHYAADRGVVYVTAALC